MLKICHSVLKMSFLEGDYLFNCFCLIFQLSPDLINVSYFSGDYKEIVKLTKCPLLSVGEYCRPLSNFFSKK